MATFSELKTECKDRLNLSSTEADTRIGRAINRKYRIVTSSIGMQLSRRATVQQNVSIGVSTVTFTSTEKVINVVNREVSPYRTLSEVTLDELREDMPFSTEDSPTKYAISSHTADTVTILINRIPQTAFNLYADVHQTVSDLSGSTEPAFPESFHDVLIEGVLADELRKMEKPALAQMAQREYERILSDLRMWIAKSNYLDIYQGKTSDAQRSAGGGSGGGGSVNGATSYTQTGLITFTRGSAVAPFAISNADAAKVTNLDADKLDGFDWGAIGTHVLFSPDATFDIGAAGTTRPRDIHLSRDVLVGGLITGRDITVFTSTAVGTQNNWDPSLVTGTTLLSWSGASALTVTGFEGGQSGDVIHFYNRAATGIIASFTNLSASSDADNRLLNKVTGANTPVAPGGHATFVYLGDVWALIEHSQGEWITPTFAAGDWTGSGSMTVTVASGDVATDAYMLSETTLHVALEVDSIDLGGTTSTAIRRSVPGGFTATKSMRQHFQIQDNNLSPTTAGLGRVSDTVISIYRDLTTNTNWTLGTDSGGLWGQIQFEVA